MGVCVYFFIVIIFCLDGIQIQILIIFDHENISQHQFHDFMDSWIRDVYKPFPLIVIKSSTATIACSTI
jgi:hypothetical protein